jgi:hypothetical protein
MKRKLLVLFFVCSNLLLAETIGRVMKANGTVLVKPNGITILFGTGETWASYFER